MHTSNICTCICYPYVPKEPTERGPVELLGGQVSFWRKSSRIRLYCTGHGELTVCLYLVDPPNTNSLNWVQSWQHYDYYWERTVYIYMKAMHTSIYACMHTCIMYVHVYVTYTYEVYVYVHVYILACSGLHLAHISRITSICYQFPSPLPPICVYTRATRTPSAHNHTHDTHTHTLCLCVSVCCLCLLLFVWCIHEHSRHVTPFNHNESQDLALIIPCTYHCVTNSITPCNYNRLILVWGLSKPILAHNRLPLESVNY
jgi:hypothetical protein